MTAVRHQSAPGRGLVVNIAIGPSGRSPGRWSRHYDPLSEGGRQQGQRPDGLPANRNPGGWL